MTPYDQDFSNDLHKSLWTETINFHIAMVAGQAKGV